MSLHLIQSRSPDTPASRQLITRVIIFQVDEPRSGVDRSASNTGGRRATTGEEGPGVTPGVQPTMGLGSIESSPGGSGMEPQPQTI